MIKTYQNLNDRFIKKRNLSNTEEFENQLKDYLVNENMLIQDIMETIIESIKLIFDQNKFEKDKETENKENFKKFNSLLDLLFYLYLNWTAQDKQVYNENNNERKTVDNSHDVFNRINNRVFTVPELEGYSGTLVHLDKKREQMDENQEPKSMTNINNKKRSIIKKKTIKFEKILLVYQNIPYKEMEKFTDAEITETLNNFNLFQAIWSHFPLKQKSYLFKKFILNFD